MLLGFFVVVHLLLVTEIDPADIAFDLVAFLLIVVLIVTLIVILFLWSIFLLFLPIVLPLVILRLLLPILWLLNGLGFLGSSAILASIVFGLGLNFLGSGLLFLIRLFLVQILTWLWLLFWLFKGWEVTRLSLMSFQSFIRFEPLLASFTLTALSMIGLFFMTGQLINVVEALLAESTCKWLQCSLFYLGLLWLVKHFGLKELVCLLIWCEPSFLGLSHVLTKLSVLRQISVH